MTAVHVRSGTLDDADDLAGLAALTFPLACPPHTTEAARSAFIRDVLSPERFREYLADPARSLLVAQVVDLPDRSPPALAGYAMLVDGEPDDPDVRAVVTARPTIELSKFYVHPAHHGQGVADALMQVVLDVARRGQRVSLWLGVNNENARARRFYLRHGFTVVGTKHFRVGDRLEDDVVLEQDLRTVG
ncbi:MAG TPA: N-acetyltransferase [Cellulomonadaceae bacterium]|nr:N-acetyltransferase [Cellulomonadaceae bacterium]